MNFVTSRIKSITKYILYLVYLAIITCFLFEIVFRFLPVSTSKFIQPVNDINPISHFQKNNLVVINREPDFSNIIYKKTNNYGYFTNHDYTPNKLSNKCRSIVIGDSYVEAVQVDNNNTFHSLLHQEACETYALGKSGDALSQYLAYAEFAVSEFNPDNLIFTIIFNDYDESLLKYNNSPSSHYFNENGELERIDFEPSLVGRIIRTSSFLYYLYNDLKIHFIFKDALKQISDGRMADIYHPNQTLIDDANKRLVNREIDARWAVDIFLKKISDLALKQSVILVIDGDRNGIYEDHEHRNESKAIGRLNKYMIQNAKLIDNVVVIDMQKYFWKDWSNNKKEFNSWHDYHWNSYGHFVVAKTINCYLQENLCDSLQ